MMHVFHEGVFERSPCLFLSGWVFTSVLEVCIGLIVKVFRLSEFASTFNWPLKFMCERKGNIRMFARQGKNKAANLSLCHFASACFHFAHRYVWCLILTKIKKKKIEKF